MIHKGSLHPGEEPRENPRGPRCHGRPADVGAQESGLRASIPQDQRSVSSRSGERENPHRHGEGPRGGAPLREISAVHLRRLALPGGRGPRVQATPPAPPLFRKIAATPANL